MRKYTHWLKINGTTTTKEEAKQYQEIEKYLRTHKNATAEIYLYEFNLFDRVVKLVCDENYTNLDMEVNSFSNRLRRLSGKPKNIIYPNPFTVPKDLV